MRCDPRSREQEGEEDPRRTLRCDPRRREEQIPFIEAFSSEVRPACSSWLFSVPKGLLSLVFARGSIHGKLYVG